MRTAQETQRLHGERVEARQAERADTRFFDPGPRAKNPDPTIDKLEELYEEITGRPSPSKIAAAKRAGDILFTALLLDILASAKKETEAGGRPKEPEPQERIEPIVDNKEPPFFNFWNKLNSELTAKGLPEAGYKQARDAFSGGKTPDGALTFIGSDWEGVRAVPATSHRSGQATSYHGEFREVSDNGTFWHVVANKHSKSIAYETAEYALKAAKRAKTDFEKAAH